MNEQMTFDEYQATINRDNGIAVTMANAESKIPGWTDAAFEQLCEFVDGNPFEFMTEDVRAFAERNGLESPPNLKAWSGVMLRAAKMKIIKKVGIGQRKQPQAHRAFTTIWKRA
jgi:hypothetical protein